MNRFDVRIHAIRRHAEQIARTITEQQQQRSRALVQVTIAFAATGQHQHAEQIGHTVTDLDLRAETAWRSQSPAGLTASGILREQGTGAGVCHH
jgi:hypothetical protein